MAKYSGDAPSIAPGTSADNWTLVAPASTSGKVIEVHWGGEVTTSTAMHTRVARSTGGTTAVAGNTEKLHPFASALKIPFNTGWSAQPTLAAGTLFGESWNAHGGVVRWLAAPGEEFIIIASNVSCRNTVGTATSSYGTVWEED